MTDIRSLLMEVNPVEQAEVPDTLRAELFAEVRRTAPPRRRTLKPWQWPLPTIVVGLVAAGGLATAATYLVSQQTKDQSAALATAPKVLGEDGPGLNYGAQVKAAAEAIMATTPYPPGDPETMDWEHYRPSSAPGEMQGSIQALIEHRAACKWRHYWLAAKQRGRVAAAADAAQILHEATRWPSVQADRGELLAMQERAANAAAQGSVAKMRATLRVDCRGSP